MSLPIPPRFLYGPIVSAALREDLEHGDITTTLTIPKDMAGSAVIVSKEDTVIAGVFAAREAFLHLDPEARFFDVCEEGETRRPHEVVMGVKGRLSAILQAERVALNFLQRLSGVASLTRAFATQLAGLSCAVTDTRKTTPGLRILEKFAVLAGGGKNHRFGLSDGVLIKDNHIAACGSVQSAVTRARKGTPHTLLIEVEVSSTESLEEAVKAGANAVLLDNMTPDEVREAATFARSLKKDIVLEASGGINLTNVRAYGEAGVDIVSVGALTHSARARDLSLRVLPSK